MKYRLSHAAQVDLADIWRYIAQDDPLAADHFLDLLGRKFVLLARHPDLGRACDELSAGLQRFPVGHYLVFYRLDPHHIEIVRVLHGARDIEACLDSGE
jgi:toxin ParE1/3/4